MNFDGAKVTVMGLGRFGGGVGVTKWLVAQGTAVAGVGGRGQWAWQRAAAGVVWQWGGCYPFASRFVFGVD